MNLTTNLTNEEKMNGEIFQKLNSEMKGAILLSMAEQLRNEEIMVKLAMDEKELRELCKKYGIAFAHRNTSRPLNGNRVLVEGELDDLLAKKKVDFNEFITYDRKSQRQIVYAFVKQFDKFNKMIREVFDVKFYNFFLALYTEEKKARNKESFAETIQDNEIPATESAMEQPMEPSIEEPTNESMESPMAPPTLQLLPHLTDGDGEFEDPFANAEDRLKNHPIDFWNDPFMPAKIYSTQLKHNGITKKQARAKLRFLLDEMEDLTDDILVDINFKIEEHQEEK